MQMQASAVMRSTCASMPERRADEGGSHENSAAQCQQPAAGQRCSGDLRKSDNSRSTSDSGPRRALPPPCEFADSQADPDAAASSLQLKRVFSAISAPFGLATSDSCSPLDLGHWRPPSTCPLGRLSEHAGRPKNSRLRGRTAQALVQARTRGDSPDMHPHGYTTRGTPAPGTPTLTRLRTANAT